MLSNRPFQGTLNFVLLVFLCCSNVLGSPDNPPVSIRTIVDGRFDHYPICGLLSLRVAAQTYNIEIDLNELLSSKNLSDPTRGSSMKDLCGLAERYGLAGVGFGRLGVESVTSATHPLLLHFSK